MQLIRLAPATATSYLTKRLVTEAQQGPVVWLVSGGSNAVLSAAVARELPEDAAANITIGLIDERYGEPGHNDSNWLALQHAGLPLDKFETRPMLHTKGSLEDCITQYQNWLRQVLAAGTPIIAQLGIGSDGHLAGILPRSPAAEPTSELVLGYQSEPFTRITVTAALLTQVTAAYAFAYGTAKAQALHGLTEQLPISDQPAQILKAIPEAYVYNNQVEEIV